MTDLQEQRTADNFYCPICTSRDTSGSYSLFDDRYGYPGSFQQQRCANCGHRFLIDPLSSEQLDDLYTRFYPRSSCDPARYKPHIPVSGLSAWFDGACRSAFRWVPQNVRVLDIGCGTCEALGYHRSRGCEVYGVEADKNVLRIAEGCGFNVHLGLFDPTLYQQGSFDYVTLDQVLEHAYDPVIMLLDIVKTLKPGGRIVISTPNASGWGQTVFKRHWINWHVPYHVHIFSKRSIIHLVERAGLLLEKCCTITSSEWLHYQWLHLCTYPRMGEPSSFWSPKRAVPATARQTYCIRLFHMLHQLKLNHVITRFADAFDYGDNLLVILRKPA